MLKRAIKHVLIVLAAIVSGLFFGFLAAILTSPFWGWFEEKTGIESLGHSGPADWVFELMGAVFTISFFCILEYLWRTRR
jgi:uncharacterized protein involved in cysteine biosynthesis